MKNYNKPNLEIININKVDVITASPENENPTPGPNESETL